MLVQEKEMTNNNNGDNVVTVIHTLTIPSHRFSLATMSSSPKSKKYFQLILITATASLILYSLLPIVLWIIALIVQTLQRQQQQSQGGLASSFFQQEQDFDTASCVTLSLSSSYTSCGVNTIFLAQQVIYETVCYWTYHVVPRLTAGLLTLHIAICLAYVGWLKVQKQQQQ
jgi:cobalamin synthase